jgi:hypothetical protein
VFVVTRLLCRSLRRRGGHPLRDWDGAIVVRRPDGAIATLDETR